MLAALSFVARGRLRWLIFWASAILLVQWLILMPRLEERTLALIAGAVVEPSSLHHWWIILDVARMGIYAWVLRKAAHYLLSSEPKDCLES
ncbi:hypothetical protein GCM10011411_25040 [Aurantiacibacter arachoides]|nr:hypothetical protein GCM10011411_25040 [Aurantiacibacter arachoides]